MAPEVDAHLVLDLAYGYIEEFESITFALPTTSGDCHFNPVEEAGWTATKGLYRP